MKEQLENQIDFEYNHLKDMEKLQQEMTTLHNSLNACIDIVSSSIYSKGVNEQLDRMKSDNHSEYMKAVQEVDSRIDESRDNINRLNEERKSLLEEEKES